MSDYKKPNNKSEKSIEIPNFINSRDNRNSSKSSRRTTPSQARKYDSEYDEEDFDEAYRPNKRVSYRSRKKKKKSSLGRILIINLSLLIILSGLLFLTPPGRKAILNIAGNYIYNNLEYQPAQNAIVDSDEAAAGVNNEQIVQKPVMNFLLIGIEEIKGDQNTDSMVIATMNTRTHTLKLTSLMRDLYVEIPGYNNNRINSAYAKGGIKLLYETIKLNFGIDIDGYCMVNFEAFEQIVDMVGGVEITLTEQEASYLRTTNYISNKSNRNVVAGTQLMNGNQALGYCRVRKVSTGTENNDFGRTQRHRIVLEAIYNKLKSKNIVSLVLLMNKILTQVEIKTDINNKTFNYCLEEAVKLKIKELETMRIPSDGTFDNASVMIGSRKSAVLVPKDWEATKKYINDFIYDTDYAAN
jgi:LCP family protein required for cell wall assembly